MINCKDWSNSHKSEINFKINIIIKFTNKKTQNIKLEIKFSWKRKKIKSKKTSKVLLLVFLGICICSA